MAPGNLLEVVLSQDRNIKVDAGYCKRVRYRKSDCRICLEICPENAISLNPGPTINGDCSDCGLCRAACPTEVFRDDHSTDRRLLNQAKSRSGKAPPEQDKRLSIHCHLAEGRNADSLPVPCLGTVTENIHLGAAISGFDEVELTKGICSGCRLKRGETMLLDAVTTSRALLESVGAGRVVIRVVERAKKKGNEEILSRRDVFSRTSRKVMDKAASFLHRKESAIREDVQEILGDKREAGNGKRRSPRRELLRTLLKSKAGVNGLAARNRTEFPWRRMEVDEKRCAACGTCRALCPTGAISRNVEQGRHLACFTRSSCANCFLCREACPEQAIAFEGGLTLADLLDDDADVVARVDLTSCVACGEGMPAGNGRFCPTCRKRQVQPMHGKPCEEVLCFPAE